MPPAVQTPVLGLTEWLLIGFLAFLWGGSFFFFAVAVHELPPLTVAFARVAIGGVVLAGIALATIRVPLTARLLGAFLVMGLLNNAIPFTLTATAQMRLDSGLASILNGTTPIFSAILAVLVGQESFSTRRLGAVVLGFLGVVVLLGPTTLTGGGGTGWSALLVLGTAFSYACAGIFGRRAFQGVPPMLTATGQVAGAALLLAPVALLVDAPWRLQSPSAAAWGALVGIGLLCTALAYPIFFRVLRTAGATNLMLVTLLNPVSALLLGILVLGERPHWTAFAGMALIFAGLLVMDGRLLNLRRAAAKD